MTLAIYNCFVFSATAQKAVSIQMSGENKSFAKLPN